MHKGPVLHVGKVGSLVDQRFGIAAVQGNRGSDVHEGVLKTTFPEILGKESGILNNVRPRRHLPFLPLGQLTRRKLENVSIFRDSGIE